MMQKSLIRSRKGYLKKSLKTTSEIIKNVTVLKTDLEFVAITLDLEPINLKMKLTTKKKTKMKVGLS